MRLHYTSNALADLKEIANYIADESGSRDVATKFIRRIREKCRLLATLSGAMGSPRPELGKHVRSTPFQSYAIYFQYRERKVEILNVLKASRDAERVLNS